MTQQPSAEQLQEQLNYTQAKLNEQKVQIEQLHRAVAQWRNAASPKPIAIYNQAWRVPLMPGNIPETRIERSAVVHLLATWAGEVDVPGMYFIRLVEQTIPADSTHTPWDTYQVTLHVWEKPDHGTSNSNEGE